MAIPTKALGAIEATKKAIRSSKTEDHKWKVIWAIMKSAIAEGQAEGIEGCFNWTADGWKDLPGGFKGFEKEQKRWERWDRKYLASLRR